MAKKTKIYSITVRKEYADFIDNESRQFKLSNFIDVSLNAYIDYVRRLRKDGETNV